MCKIPVVGVSTEAVWNLKNKQKKRTNKFKNPNLFDVFFNTGQFYHLYVLKKLACIHTEIKTHNAARSLIVGVSVQAVNNGAVDCEGTAMTQTAHGVELVSLCV